MPPERLSGNVTVFIVSRGHGGMVRALADRLRGALPCRFCAITPAVSRKARRE